LKIRELIKQSCNVISYSILCKWPSWSLSWSYGSWIYNYLCNQCLTPQTLWVRIPLRQDVLETTLCDEVVGGDFRQVVGFLWFPPPIKLTATI